MVSSGIHQSTLGSEGGWGGSAGSNEVLWGTGFVLHHRSSCTALEMGGRRGGGVCWGLLGLLQTLPLPPCLSLSVHPVFPGQRMQNPMQKAAA